MSGTHKLAVSMLVLFWTVGAQATWYDVTQVRTGSSGFGASLFHEASSGNHMSGANVGDILSMNGSGVNVFNDSTGFFSATFNLGGAASGTVKLAGSLYFDTASGSATEGQMNTGPGGAFSTLAATFSGTDLSGGDPDLYFKTGYQCCGSSGFDPNTFLPSTNPAGHLITLWGANGWDADSEDYSSSTSLGVDLRVLLTERSSPPATGVPEPATIALAALGLAAVRLRRRAS